MVNEHHFTYFNINPSSTVLAAALIMRTKCMKVGVIGHVLPLRHPIQTAEEFAQLDVLSGGRFIGGIVRGVPQEHVSFNVDLEMYDKTGAERTVMFQGPYGQFKAIRDQRAPNAAVALQRRAEAGEDYVIRLTVTVPADGPQPDPTSGASFFELE